MKPFRLIQGAMLHIFSSRRLLVWNLLACLITSCSTQMRNGVNENNKENHGSGNHAKLNFTRLYPLKFHKYCGKGKLNKIKKVFKNEKLKKMLLHQRNSLGYPPVLTAAYCGQWIVVHYLLHGQQKGYNSVLANCTSEEFTTLLSTAIKTYCQENLDCETENVLEQIFNIIITDDTKLMPEYTVLRQDAIRLQTRLKKTNGLTKTAKGFLEKISKSPKTSSV